MVSATEHLTPQILLEEARQLVEALQPARALELLETHGNGCPAVANARAVCHLRLGQTTQALRILRALLFPAGELRAGPEGPVLYQANLAAALLAANRPLAASYVLGRLRRRDHPAVRQVRSAWRNYKSRLGLGERVGLMLGFEPKRYVPVSPLNGMI